MGDTFRPADGFRFVILPAVGSTNDLLSALARHGAEEGTVVIARQQRAGRGRRGHEWISPPGNLYFSVLLKPDLPAAVGGQMSFVAGLAVAEALSPRVEGRSISLKWPNDVLVEGRKIAGILAEATVDGDRVGHVVLGIGINLATAPTEEVRWPAVALADFGAAPRDPIRFAAGLTGCIARWMEIWQRDGFEPVRAAWMGRAWGLGRDFRTDIEGEALSGRFDGIDADGSLVLELPGVGTRLIRSGEIFPAEAG